MKIDLINRDEMSCLASIDRLGAKRPCSETDFYAAVSQEGYSIVGAKNLGDLIGYVIYQLDFNKITVQRLCVDPGFRRMSVGTMLMAYVRKVLEDTGRIRLIAEPSEDDLDYHMFLKAMGFRGVNVIRTSRRYNGRDAYRMEYRAKECSGVR